MTVRELLLCATVLASGCSDRSNPSNQSPTPAPASPTWAAPASNPLEELRAIMETGKLKISEEKRSTLVSATLDVKETTSLVTPYVGQIVSEWDDGASDGLIVIYYMYENNHWTPVWCNRGARSGHFPGELREGKALLTDDGFNRGNTPAEWIYPWSINTSYRFKVWDLGAQ